MKLCINCDDFGYNSDINRGIFEAIDLGIITSCSVMVHSATRQDLTRLKETKISIGLHITLTGSGKHSLALTPFHLLLGVMTKKITQPQIEQSIKDQYNRLRYLYSDPLTHIDTHQHVHIIPAIFQTLAHFATEHTIPYLRIPREKSQSWSARKLMLNSFFHRATDPVCFWGTGFMGKNFTVRNILKQLDYLKTQKIKKSLWMVHAGYTTTGNKIDPYNTERENELRILKQLLPELSLRCQLVPMGDLLDCQELD